jgi:hypothetical protein
LRDELERDSEGLTPAIVGDDPTSAARNTIVQRCRAICLSRCGRELNHFAKGRSRLATPSSRKAGQTPVWWSASTYALMHDVQPAVVPHRVHAPLRLEPRFNPASNRPVPIFESAASGRRGQAPLRARAADRIANTRSMASAGNSLQEKAERCCAPSAQMRAAKCVSWSQVAGAPVATQVTNSSATRGLALFTAASPNTKAR